MIAIGHHSYVKIFVNNGVRFTGNRPALSANSVDVSDWSNNSESPENLLVTLQCADVSATKICLLTGSCLQIFL